MKRTVMTTAALATLLLGGCVGPDTRSTDNGLPRGRAPQCLAADTVAARCERVNGVPTCRLAVSATNSVPVVLPYKLKVGQHGPNRAVTIVWELIGDDVEFTDKHGPMLNGRPLREDPRFKDGWPSNDPNGATRNDPGRYYRIVFLNDRKTPEPAGLEYVITFRSVQPDGSTAPPKEHACDPTIANEAG